MKGNIKALTNDELKFIVENYTFQNTESGILVLVKGRKTFHEKGKRFTLLLPLERRKINITTRAIDLWVENYIDRYSLIEVQNAINTLSVTFQSVTEANIKEQLELTRSQLDNLK